MRASLQISFSMLAILNWQVETKVEQRSTLCKFGNNKQKFGVHVTRQLIQLELTTKNPSPFKNDNYKFNVNYISTHTFGR